jgi:hypothetical protein
MVCRIWKLSYDSHPKLKAIMSSHIIITRHIIPNPTNGPSKKREEEQARVSPAPPPSPPWTRSELSSTSSWAQVRTFLRSPYPKAHPEFES